MKKVLLSVAIAFMMWLLSVSHLSAQGIIDPRSGQLFLTATDLVIEAGPMDLEIKRFLDPAPHKPGLLGSRWSLNWESRLERDGDAVVIEGGTGAGSFTSEGSAGYKSASGDRVVFDKDGRAVRTTPDGHREIFDSKGRLAERRDPNGNKIILHYGPEDRLEKIEGPFGTSIRFTKEKDGLLVETSTMRRVRYTLKEDDLTGVRIGSQSPSRYGYDTKDRLISIEDPAFGMIQLAYDPEGRIKSRRWADGSTELYEWNEASSRLRYTNLSGGVTTIQWSKDKRHEEVTDPLGRKTVTEYDETGRPLSVTGPTGAKTEITYDRLGRTISMKNPIGQTTRFEYEGESPRIKTITQPDGSRQVFEYDDRGNLTFVKVGSEIVTVYTYHPDGNIATVKGKGRVEEKLTYHLNGRLKSVANVMGETIHYEYDSRGNLVRETNPLGGATVWTYDDQDRLVSAADPTGVTARYKYDDKGRLSEVIDPAGGITRYQHNAKGQQVSETDPAGGVSRYQYDGAGRLLKTTWPDKTTETHEYDAAGNLIKSTDRQGRVSKFEYDPFGRLSKERKPEGLRITYHYDSLSNLTAQEDSAGTKRRFERDPSGRLIAEIDPSGALTRYEYDPSGNLSSRTDPNKRTKLFSYTRESILTRVKEPSGDTATYDYDVVGRPVALHHPSGGVTRLTYDAMGNLLTSTDPLGNQSRWGYDLAGRVVSNTNAAGQVTRFTYDKAGRLKEKQLPNGERVRYEYDVLGNLTLADDGKFPVRQSYDHAGRLIKREYPAIKKNVSYEYNKDGFRTKLISGGRETRYEYNETKQVSAIIFSDGKRITLTHGPGGELKSIRYPNGITGRWEYDGAGRITKIDYVDKKGSSVSSSTYVYDPAGNPIEIQHGGQALRFGFDSMDQLINEAAADRTVRYRYLPGGNRQSIEEEGKVIEYRYDAADRLIRAGEEELAYDASGNLISRKGPQGITTYEYDPENRLTKVVSPDGKSIAYGYAPTGERVWRRDEKGLTYYLYNGLDLVQEVTEDGKVKASYVHGPGIDRPLAFIREGKSYYYHSDRLGSIGVISDQAGKAAASYRYDAFGRMKAQDAKIANPFTFTGREFDPATGLYYYRARYYDPALGRFLSTDPAEPTLDQPLKLNPYLYAQNNPVRYVDPFGLDAFSWAQEHWPVSGQEARSTQELLGDRQYMRNILAGRGPIPSTAKPEYMNNTRAALNNIEEALRSRGALPSANPNSTQPVLRPPVPGTSGSNTGAVNGGSAGRAGGQTGRVGLPGGPRIGTQVDVPRPGGNTLQGQRPGSPATGERVGPRGAGVMTLVMTAAQLINCYQEGLSPTQCATRMAGQALIGAATAAGVSAVAILNPVGAVVLTTALVGYSAGVGAVHIYEGMGELNKDWDQWRQRQAAAAAREEQEKKNVAALDDKIKNWQKNFNAELNNLRVQIEAAKARAKSAQGSASKAKTDASNLLNQLKGLESQIRQASSFCKDAELAKIQIGSDAANAIKNADLVQKGFDLANTKVSACKSKQDANDAVDIYNAAKPLISAAASSYRKANEGNELLKKLLAQAESAKSLRNQASGLATQIQGQSVSASGFADTVAAEVIHAESLFDDLKGKKKEMLAELWKVHDSFTLYRKFAYEQLAPLIKPLETEEPAFTARDLINVANADSNSAMGFSSEAQNILTALNSLSLCEGIASPDGILDQAAQAVALLGMGGEGIPDKAAACLASLTPAPTEARSLTVFNVSCSPSVVDAGDPSTCTATGSYSDDPGKVFDLTGSPTNWESGPTVQTKGLQPSSYFVKASREGMNSTAILTVREPYDVGKDPGKGVKGASVDPNIGKPFQENQPGGKPLDASGRVSAGAPVPIPGAGEPSGTDAGSTSAAGLPSPGPSGVQYPCKDPNGNIYYSPTPCPQSEQPLIPKYTPPSGQMPGKEPSTAQVPGKMQTPAPGDPAKADCLKRKGYHWHDDSKMCCNQKH